MFKGFAALFAAMILSGCAGVDMDQVMNALGEAGKNMGEQARANQAQFGPRIDPTQIKRF